MTKNKEKQFDCIKMKSSIQAQIYKETQGMSTEELLSFYNNKKSPSKIIKKARQKLAVI